VSNKIYQVFIALFYRAPRDATQSAVLIRQVVCLSVRPSLRNVEVSWSHRLEFFEDKFTVS